MAPKKGIKRGTLQEQTKELLVLAFFLQKNNNWATADDIVRFWNPKRKESGGMVLSDDLGPRERTLSRAGASKVCKRLVPEILTKREILGYNNKRVYQYQLATEEGFMRVAKRLRGAPMLLMASDYGREGIKKTVIPTLEHALDISVENIRNELELVLSQSASAFLLAIDESIGAGSIAELPRKDRLKELAEVLMCAVRLDKASGSRRRLISDDGVIKENKAKVTS